MAIGNNSNVSLTDLSLISQDVYLDQCNLQNGWKRQAQSNLWYLDGFFAALYVKGNDMVIAYRGTDPRDPLSWLVDALTDAQILTSQFPDAIAQSQRAISFAKEWMDQYENYNFTFTGHSLGGYLAQYAAVHVEEDLGKTIPTVAYNAPGFYDSLVDKQLDCTNMLDIVVKGDGVGAVLPLLGTRIVVPQIVYEGFMPTHSMENFLLLFNEMHSSWAQDVLSSSVHPYGGDSDKLIVGNNYNDPKLQLQVEHFGKMAATSGCIKVVEKCIE